MDEPHVAYDAHIAAAVDEYAERTYGKTCCDCCNCVKVACSGVRNPDGIAWCESMDDFVLVSDKPDDHDCLDYQ